MGADDDEVDAYVGDRPPAKKRRRMAASEGGTNATGTTSNLTHSMLEVAVAATASSGSETNPIEAVVQGSNDLDAIEASTRPNCTDLLDLFAFLSEWPWAEKALVVPSSAAAPLEDGFRGACANGSTSVAGGASAGNDDAGGSIHTPVPMVVVMCNINTTNSSSTATTLSPSLTTNLTAELTAKDVATFQSCARVARAKLASSRGLLTVLTKPFDEEGVEKKREKAARHRAKKRATAAAAAGGTEADTVTLRFGNTRYAACSCILIDTLWAACCLCLSFRIWENCEP
jgi:hypothetical protein